ncbi:ABC transporter ATP-binding protein [Romboutsia lituseburensis]|uniref:ABC-type multidrug transport system, ATPase component n=1 Tax=Romboutsia lituseburensis DSM 797 TaxID=1121325 RepID=A0A1G9J2E1_9FIRM|nr:ATP-binding cassette domain-containing protein [Romboutsia lituseburensis]SDL31501.1 ABC-type multidrug transport system, ATPase component [Romboutsia lituseburensis DSM 797]
MKETVLRVDNISKSIKRKNIIKNINFEIKEGDICGFVGPNGAGKTTLIRIITGLIKPTKGAIYINNYDVNIKRKEALLSLGAIVEAPIFFEYLTGEQALLNLSLLNLDYTKKQREEIVKESLKIVGLYERRNEKISTYSLGMKQRLGIAQSLLNNPKIIILDEPANGLDPMGMIELRELILKLNKDKNITFFISSHLLDELQKICDKLVIIKEGSLIWYGDTKDLIDDNKSNNLEEIFVNLMKENKTI